MKKVLLPVLLSIASVAVLCAAPKAPVKSAPKAQPAAEAKPVAKEPVGSDAPVRYTGILTADWKVISEAQTGIETLNFEAVRAAFDDFSKMPGYDVAKYSQIMSELESRRIDSFNGLAAGDPGALKGVQAVLALKREILLSNPLLDIDKILAVRYKIGAQASYALAPVMGTQPSNWSNQMSGDRSGFDAEIVELSGLRGDKVKSRTIYKPTNGAAVADLLLNWDAERMMFTSIDEAGKWGVFEIKRDGTGLRKVIETTEPDLEFCDGAYMPDGRIIAVSNIGYQGVPCVDGSDPVGNMISYDPKTKQIRRLTFDQDANWHPRVMNNGRLMYVRWEYTDLTHYYSRFVMHANPDGTEAKALYGSGGWFPNSVFDIQPLPGGSNSFVGVITGHHGTVRSGRLIVFDPSKGRKEVAGMVQEIPFSKRPIVPLIKDQLVDGVWPQFLKPYPLNDKYFLVTAKLDRVTPWGIYLVDVFDNVQLIASFEGEGVINPIPVKPRPVPPVIPDRINLKDKEATVFIQDIYEGEGLPGVPRGTVKQLRVFAYEYAYLKSPSDHTAQGIQSGWDIKRLLGTVNVEEDGSAIFKIPANTPVSLQPLDSEGRAIQWMRSWLTGMPGEVVSCVGCHEDQNTLPLPKRVMASVKSPSRLTPPEGGVRPFKYEFEVQPILDRACVACHTEGKKLDLRGDRPEDNSFRRITMKSNRGQVIILSKSYLALHPFVSRQGPEADIYVMKPYEYHASTSELVKILKRGHYGVALTDSEWRSLYAWIDLNAPYHSEFVDNLIPSCPTSQYDRRIELANKYGNGAGVDWRKEIADYAAVLAKKGKPVAEMPKAQPAPVYAEVSSKSFPFSAEQAKEMVAKFKESRKSVEIAPGVAINFVRIPKGEFVMGSNNVLNAAPASVVKIDKPFWMAETELTNAQYNVIFPKHDSRYIAQFWKDHVGPGYEANRPSQPVIRVSWNEAMDYCKQLSAKTGLKITLPTEAQWEWACRAGSSGAMWYGGIDADFSAVENLADVQLTKMAVTGVNPQPMKHTDAMYKYYNYIPKNEKVDDGNMVVADVAKYKPNPWGLYDMHGNVAEFTRSDYVSYPYNAKVQPTDRKVIRGGSWTSRTKNAASYSRDDAYAWQALIGVGFRPIIED